MKAFKTGLVLSLFLFISTNAQTTWDFDKSHSKIGFEVTHLVITDVEGQFNSYEGTVVSNNEDFSDAKINFTADINSIDTDNEKRDGHLKSDDFFNAEKFPKLTFVGKSFKKVDGKNYKLVGDLTIRDITKEVSLDVKYAGTVTDPWGNVKAGFNVTGAINRFDYNLKWNALMEAGGAVVGEEVRFDIDIELNKKS